MTKKEQLVMTIVNAIMLDEHIDKFDINKMIKDAQIDRNNTLNEIACILRERNIDDSIINLYII